MAYRRTNARQRVEAIAQQQMAAAQQMGQEGFLGRMFGPSRPDIQQIIADEKAARAAIYAQDQQFADIQREGDVTRATAAGVQQARNALIGSGSGPIGSTAMQGLAQNVYEQVQGGIDPQSAAASAVGASQPMQDANLALMQQAAMQQQIAEQDRLRAEQQRFASNVEPFRVQGRDIGNVRDLKTLMANEGRIVAPGQARGAYNVLRGQLLNSIRRQFEAGALQQAELEFFETLLPSADAWSTMTQGERMQMLNELEYQMTTGLRDSLALSEYDLTADEIIRPARSIDEILTPGLPQGAVPINPADNAPQPVSPSGDLMPFSGFLQQLGF